MKLMNPKSGKIEVICNTIVYELGNFDKTILSIDPRDLLTNKLINI